MFAGGDYGSSVIFETRSRTSSFLEPRSYIGTPERERLASFAEAPQTPPDSDPLLYSASSLPRRSRRKRKKGLVKRRKTHFVHVRFNKIVAHVTYAGRPFSFKGLTITLGMSEYNSLEGNWRGLFKKYRNGVIGSVIKSIATHEGRSYDPSLAVLGDGSREEKSHPSGLLQRGRNFFRKKGKASPAPSEEDDDEMRVDVVDEKAEQAGRNLLLGKM